MQSGVTTGEAGAGVAGWWVQSLAQAGGETGGGAPAGEVVMPGNPAQSGTPTQGTPQGAPGGSGGPQQGPPPGGLFTGPFMIIIFLFLVVMIISSMLTQRRERRRREELLGGISKHDRVQTVGGIIGTVQEVRDDEVVLRVDENANTRIRFAKSSIQQVIKSAGGSGGGGDTTGGGAAGT